MQPEQETSADLVDGLTVAGGTRRTFLLGTAGGMVTLGGLISAGRNASAAESTGAAFSGFAYIGCFTSAQRQARSSVCGSIA